ncbi:uncharacterized protein [Macrobrachium rosenbergii]|uniref:uncharacterized protein isoform X2 n=1 Tax=Macrobrachium rosenbergii TaxID=79674 RepID=UPI0034D54477
MRVPDWWWVTILLATLAVAAPSSEENAGNRLDETSSTNTIEPGAASVASAAATSVGTSGIFEPQLRYILGALENVDDMLRTTIPSLDRFNCLERVVCSVMSGGTSAISESPVSPITSALQQAFDPTFQQGIIQDPQTVSQELLNNPALQQLFSQGQGSQTQALQGLLSQISSIQQQNPAQNPAFQQGFPPPNPAFQQGFPPPNAAFHPGFSHNPAFGAPPPPPPPPPPPGFHPQFHPQQGFTNTFPNFRENPETEGTQRRSSVPRPQRRRKPPTRRERNGFFDFLGRLGLGRRKKRDLLDDILGGFTSQGFMGILDQMMDQYSFYPYTHAAYMGYTGSPERCEKLYPECPSTAEQLVDVFNNIHRHYPNGIPYKDRFPWPLNILLP